MTAEYWVFSREKTSSAVELNVKDTPKESKGGFWFTVLVIGSLLWWLIGICLLK